MALRGGLKDFGIADAFSLIGSQGKNGILMVSRADESVSLFVAAGAVVRAEATRRRKRELIGNMLLRAEVISPEELAAALERQKGSRRRIGDLLIESGALTADKLQTFTRLQTTETAYRVFLWQSGHYEFNQTEVPPDADHLPIRAETLLMEGFRQVDEWPAIRLRLNSYGMKFYIAEDLEAILAAAPPVAASPEMDFDFDLGDDSATGSAPHDARLRNIGDNERNVYRLINPTRDVQKLIDLSRLGEFEACKALSNLLAGNFLVPRQEKEQQPSAEATVGGIAPSYGGLPSGAGLQVVGALGATAMWLGICLSGLGVFVASDKLESFRPQAAGEFLQTYLEQQLGRSAQARVEHALAVYRAIHGSYPDALAALVADGLLSHHEAQFPWQGPYTYSHTEQEYVLLRPVY